MHIASFEPVFIFSQLAISEYQIDLFRQFNYHV